MTGESCPVCGAARQRHFKFCPVCGMPSGGAYVAAPWHGAAARLVRGEERGEEDIASVRQAAQAGDAAAQDFLGYCLEFACGTAQDTDGSVKLYRRSAAQGWARGQLNYGRCLYFGEGNYACYDTPEKRQIAYARAVVWFAKAAEQGDSYAQCWLGYCYANGRGVEKDAKKAYDWYMKAYRNGNCAGKEAMLADWDMRIASRLYQEPSVLLRTVKEAKLAVRNGDDRAAASLGNWYRRGDGVRKNFTAAYQWYSLAVRHGYPVGFYFLGDFLSEHPVIDVKDGKPPKDYRIYLQLAAQSGYTPAIRKIEDGLMLQSVATKCFIDFCNEIAALPEEEKAAFFGGEDGRDGDAQSK